MNKNMNKKRIIISIIVFLVIIVLIYLLVQPKKTTYSKDPEDWIEDKGNIKKVDVKKATEGKGYYNLNNQQYKFLSIHTAFSYDGIYKGDIFKNQYFDEYGNLVIEITQDLDPNDNILQGIIIEKFEEGKPLGYIFLDRDWKDQFPEINIVWGKNYQNLKKFVFREVSEGIYMDKIEDDPDRFNEDYSISQGGILVGNLKEKGVGILGLEDVTIIALH